MSITHIFFDLHGTLVDGSRLRRCYSAGLGRTMAARYGLTASAWEAAHQRILADWDSYYADLDLEGADGIEAMWEGIYRTTRALFRLTGTPEPEQAELTALARSLPAAAVTGCDAFYDDAQPTIAHLHAAGYVLGIISHALADQARSLVQSNGLTDQFQGPIIGPDNAGRFSKDAVMFAFAARQAGADPGLCLLVDDSPQAVQAARAAGMRALHIKRHQDRDKPDADGVILALDEVLPALKR